MKDLEGETLTTEDISHKLNISFEEAQVLAAAPALLEALEEMLNSHAGYGLGAGPCSCEAHELARAAVEAAKQS